MLQIEIPAVEYFDEKTQTFIETKAQTLQLEHSLVSLSKWESKWCKVFLSKEDKTFEETLDYIKCMTLTKNVNPETYNRLTRANFEEINQYINSARTATYVTEEKNGKINREPITSELIYFWMISYNIPFECQKWHLNRLLTLIKVCNHKNSPPKKMSKRELMKRNAALNEARKKKYNSRG